MTKASKVGLGIVVILLVAASVVFTQKDILQGRIDLNRTESLNFSCSDTWKKVLTGNYSFVYDPSHGSDRVDLSGISASQLKALVLSVENGCDMKIGFKVVSGDSFKVPTVLCDQYFIMGDLENGLYIGCNSNTPLDSNNKYDMNSEFLTDQISLWTMGKEVKLSKNRLTHDLSDNFPTSSSFFISGGEPQGDWEVNIFLKK